MNELRKMEMALTVAAGIKEYRKRRESKWLDGVYDKFAMISFHLLFLLIPFETQNKSQQSYPCHNSQKYD